MAEILPVVSEQGEGSNTNNNNNNTPITTTPAPTPDYKPPTSRSAPRRRMELRRIRSASDPVDDENKRQRVEVPRRRTLWDLNIAGISMDDEVVAVTPTDVMMYPRYGMTSVCGRRRDMEDAVAAHLLFPELHYFGVYDGHGCSHVAMRCRERLHMLLKEELEKKDDSFSEWQSAMERSFFKMDDEITAWNRDVRKETTNCRCALHMPESEAVGSTAVTAIVTPHHIIVANCGDSRAVLCRGGRAIPLSSDHKPDRPDELNRIQAAGGRVIYWDGPRVLGVLAMSRAIGDNYLKPFVCCQPEVTVTARTPYDDCLILASDGLWDVVSNETACGMARMCVRGETGCVPNSEGSKSAGETGDKACAEAAVLLTKMALARKTADNVSVVVVDLTREA